jgi:hypothetical protein
MEYEEILEKLSTHGIRITYDKKNHWMSHDDNNTWVVNGKTYAGEPPHVLYCGYSWHDAFNVLLHG